jgi:hypothetical protein
MNTVHEGNVKLTIPFDAIDRAMLPTAGGKAAKLGELCMTSLGISSHGPQTAGRPGQDQPANEIGTIGCRLLRYGVSSREAEDSDGSFEPILDRCGVVGGEISHRRIG